LITALSDQVTTLDTHYDAPSKLEIGNAEVTNYHMNNYGNVTLERGFELSANTVFAQVADQIGAQRLVAGAENLGFNKPLNTDFSAAVSLMPDPAQMTEWETAWAGVGQPVGEHSSPPGPQATVIQMAMVASAVANNGTLMVPHLTSYVTSAEGKVLSQTANQSLGQVITPDVVAQMHTAMEGVVQSGTATATKISGYTICGKTGTAQTSNPVENSWFIGWIELNGENYVVAVLLEQQPSGSAVPKAKGIFEELIKDYGNQP